MSGWIGVLRMIPYTAACRYLPRLSFDPFYPLCERNEHGARDLPTQPTPIHTDLLSITSRREIQQRKSIINHGYLSPNYGNGNHVINMHCYLLLLGMFDN